MRLHIENFAKIGEADITIDGITVIAGENNTGKSTVGKILFSQFNALCNIEHKVMDERLNEIEQSTRMILQNDINAMDISRSMLLGKIWNMSNRIRQNIRGLLGEKGAAAGQDIREIAEKEVGAWKELRDTMNPAEWSALIDKITQNINEVLELPEENIVMEVISRYFNNVFYDQMHSLAPHTANDTMVELEIKGKKNTISFTKNRCKEFISGIDIAHKAIYIDNPFIIDELSTINDLNPMGKLLKELLTDTSGTEPMDGIIETLRAKEKLSDIYAALGSVVDGDIEINKAEDEFYLKNEHFDEPISFHNLSTGMKSFMILKLLVEKGCIKEKDVIILDEPEIHLHPQWQIAYAELIVLLQKHFDLSVVVTTHSPYFVDAINLFSRKYETDAKTNYYLSANEGDVAVMENVTDHIDVIYKNLKNLKKVSFDPIFRERASVNI